MIFHIVEKLAESPFFLFLCGCGLTIVPFAGIMYITEKESFKIKNNK
jgi:hypothetical protein